MFDLSVGLHGRQPRSRPRQSGLGVGGWNRRCAGCRTRGHIATASESPGFYLTRGQRGSLAFDGHALGTCGPSAGKVAVVQPRPTLRHIGAWLDGGLGGLLASVIPCSSHCVRSMLEPRHVFPRAAECPPLRLQFISRFQSVRLLRADGPNQLGSGPPRLISSELCANQGDLTFFPISLTSGPIITPQENCPARPLWRCSA